jgi:hypothetical protein
MRLLSCKGTRARMLGAIYLARRPGSRAAGEPVYAANQRTLQGSPIRKLGWPLRSTADPSNSDYLVVNPLFVPAAPSSRRSQAPGSGQLPSSSQLRVAVHPYSAIEGDTCSRQIPSPCRLLSRSASR